MDKVLYNVVYSNVFCRITEQAEYFYDELKITDVCVHILWWLAVK